MKKINTLFRKVDVQGSLITVTIFAVVVVVTVLTWGK
jgi:hypothetical protein